jgi:hypothetical protein
VPAVGPSDLSDRYVTAFAVRFAEQAAVQTIRPEARGNGEHHLPVRHGREGRGVEPLRPDGEPLRVATRTRRRPGTYWSPARPRRARGRTRAQSARRRRSAGAASAHRTPYAGVLQAVVLAARQDLHVEWHDTLSRRAVLEVQASGCVPVVRDALGVRCWRGDPGVG